MAKECADLAMPSIVHAKDFALARTFITNPEGAIRKWSRLLNEDIADLAKEPPRKAPVQEGYVHYYVERVRILLAVLVGVGDLTLAESIRQAAVTSIESSSIRDAVDAALAKQTSNESHAANEYFETSRGPAARCVRGHPGSRVTRVGQKYPRRSHGG